jgi:hypothetical protein
VHAVGPDMCQHRTPVWPRLRPEVFFALGSWDPTVSGPDPPRGPRSVPGVRHFPVGVRIYCHHLGVYRLHWPRGGPGAAHVEGRRCCSPLD